MLSRSEQQQVVDTDLPIDPALDKESLATFADGFFEALIMDWCAISKRRDALRRAENAYREVKGIVKPFRDKLKELRKSVKNLEEERRSLVEET